MIGGRYLARGRQKANRLLIRPLGTGRVARCHDNAAPFHFHLNAAVFADILRIVSQGVLRLQDAEKAADDLFQVMIGLREKRFGSGFLRDAAEEAERVVDFAPVDQAYGIPALAVAVVLEGIEESDHEKLRFRGLRQLNQLLEP